MARVLVTGAGGFVGSNLVRALLKRGDEVHACVRLHGNSWRLSDITKNIVEHVVDMGDAASIETAVSKSKPDIVYHLVHYGGNQGQSDGKEIRRIIIEGTAHLYEACMRAGVEKIVNAGSSSEYGAQLEAMREDMRPEPNSEYGVAKLWSSLYGEHLRREKGMFVTTLRLFSVYGPFEAGARFFPAVILALMEGKVPKLSNPDTVRDFVHVDDVVAAFMLAPEKPAGVYNVGTGVQTRLSDAARTIQMSLGTNVELTWGSASGRSFDTRSWKADISHVRAALGWQAEMPLSEGVKKTVEWFKEHRHLYEKKS